ncbi:hypothetical protein [Azohydromonas australica]|uniref:hypothetical protein n=1 Tax=Azohydromonas australica TaxID=364039 RepID=UPI000413F071|nr:hypothetical protein [Azohydromonas australica]
MKVASSSLQMAAAHAESHQVTVRESFEAWSPGQRVRYDAESTQASASLGIGAAVQISQSGRLAAARAEAAGAVARQNATVSAEVSRSGGTDEAEAPSDRLDPRLRLMRAVLERLLGERIRLYGDLPQDAAPAAPTPPAAPAAGSTGGVGLRYDLERTVQESESMQFQARGMVRTADGRDIKFSVQLQLERSFASSESLHVRLGEQPKDPLILSYPGRAVELTDTKFSFDLDADGKQERISFVKPGSGFLVFDRNADGQVNDGSELFGTRSGDGFAELAALDGDGNGWIDENDADFGRLRLWTKDADGNDQLQDLLSANVGALSTQRTATPFIFKDANNREQGVMRASSVFVQEDGTGAGTVSQVDLVA